MSRKRLPCLHRSPAWARSRFAYTTSNAAVAFYRDALGLDYLFTAGSLAFLTCGDVRLMLGKPESDEFDHPSSTIYFRVDDIHAAREDLAGRGVPFIDEPHLIARMPDHELWMTFFTDPDANLHALMSEIR